MPQDFLIHFLFIILQSIALGFIINLLVYHFFIKKYITQLHTKLPLIINEKISTLLDSELNIEQKINDPALLQKAMPTIEKHIDDFINVKLATEIPMLSMFVGGKTTDKIKSVFINNIEILLPQLLNQFATDLISTPKILAAVQQPVETMITSTAGTLQQSIKTKFLLLGVITGLIFGLVEVLRFIL